MITPQQITFMEQHRSHYDTLVKAGFLINIGHEVKNGILEVARVFAPAYQANLWCSPCVCDLVKFSYAQYDKWKSENVQAATFPKQDCAEPHCITDKPKRKYVRKNG